MDLAERSLHGPATQIIVRLVKTGAPQAGLLFFGALAGLPPHPRDYLQVCAERSGQPAASVRLASGSRLETRLARRSSAGAMSHCGRVGTDSARKRDGIPLKRASQSRALRERPAISRPAAVPGPRPSGPSAPHLSAREGKLQNAGHYLGLTPPPGASFAPRKANRRTRSASAPLRGRPHHRCAASAPFVVNNARLLPWVRIKRLAYPRFGRTPTARRSGKSLRPASGAARDLLREPRELPLPRGQPGSAKRKDAARRKNALPFKDAEASSTGLEENPQSIPR